MNSRVMIVDDDQSMCEMLKADLERRGFSVQWYTKAAEAFDELCKADFDVVLSDLKMKDMDGLQLCERIVANRPDIPVVVVTAFGSLETAIAAIRVGAYDFITKPFQVDALVLTLQRAHQLRGLREKIKFLSRAVEETQKFDELIGSSKSMKNLFELLNRIGDSEASVLVTGESGSGKELVARALHRLSRRKTGPFVALNCAAMTETLLESELFGHVKGAFTDAHTQRTGLLVEAGGGTLFLDEIGDMPLSLQPKFLRAIEERKARPVGSNEEIPFDARIVAATNKDLETAAEDGRFREDLLFRINVIRVEVPPLRSRGLDVLLLAQHFLGHFAARTCKEVSGISQAASEKLLSYHWPGNVRELRNCMERAVTLTRYEEIAVDDLPEKIKAYQVPTLSIGTADPQELVSMEQVEREYIAHVMKGVGGNKNLAARILGFDRKTLYRKLQRYRI